MIFDKDFLTLQEVVDYTTLSRATIWRYEKNGNFPKKRSYGRRVFYLKSEIEEWFNSMPVKD